MSPRTWLLGLLSNCWWAIRLRLWRFEAWQFLYRRGLAWLRRDLYMRLASQETDVVVEGFPRSANTYLVQALILISDGHLQIAHHLHDPCQIRTATRLRIPCFVIVRDPLDAISSWKLKAPHIRTTLMLRIYDEFYQRVAQDQAAVTFIRYSDVVTSTTEVVSEIMRQIDPKARPNLTELSDDRIFAAIDARKHEREDAKDVAEFALTVARPTIDKADRKQDIKSRIEASQPGLLQLAKRRYEQVLPLCLTIENSVLERAK